MENVIKVNNLSKKYILGEKSSGNLRYFISEKIKSFSKKNYESFWALKNVNFNIKKGEVVGIIGKNGAGKSTLLKILSQITAPSKGKIELTGRVASLLEVGTGFHPELTGKENIFLNGTILGMSRKEVSSKFNEIVRFSGIEKFIDTPVKHYSSGMYVRLAFAVAAHLEPEILMIDEVLAVGDAEFQKKCIGKMKDVSNHGRTVLFVSHNMSAVKNLCDRVICISNGEVVYDGEVNEGIKTYLGNKNFKQIKYNLINVKREKSQNDIIFKSLQLNKVSHSPNDDIQFVIELKNQTNKEFNNLKIALLITDQYDNIIYHMNNKFISINNIPYSEDSKYIFNLKSNSLKGGIYKIRLRMFHDEIQQDYISDSDICLEIMDENIYNYHNSSHISGYVQPKYSFHIEK